MRLSTILDPRYPMAFRERINRLKQLATMEFVWRLPKYVIYWAVVRGTVATAGDHRNPGDIKGVEILDHLDPEKKPMTVNLNCEMVEVGEWILVTAQLKIEVSDPEAMSNHALVAELYAALEPARKVVEKLGMAKGISLSMQPYIEEDDDDDQAG